MLSCGFSQIKFLLFTDHSQKPRKLHTTKNFHVWFSALLRRFFSFRMFLAEKRLDTSTGINYQR